MHVRLPIMDHQTQSFPISNVRAIRALVADAPANFAEMAVAAGLTLTEESAPWGTRFIIDFADLPAADSSHPLVRQLAAIAAENHNDEFGQIWLETK